MNIFVGQVGNPTDGALLDGPHHLFSIFHNLQMPYLITHLLVLFFDGFLICRHLFHQEGSAYDVQVMLQAYL